MRHAPSVTLKSWFVVIASFVACGVPFVAGMAVFVDPLLADRSPEWVPVANLESLPADGVPRRVPVVVARSDAWARLPEEVVGAVFLRRTAMSGAVQALRATYHIGSTVEFDEAAGRFEVPCWENVDFDVSGRRLHSVQEWGDLRQVRSVVTQGKVYVNVSDATAGNP